MRSPETQFFPSGARVLLSVFYIAICVAVTAAVQLLGAPEFSVLVYVTAILVAVLGVPHGGLDHWTGRRLLVSRFHDSWWLMFFPGYVAVGVSVAMSWFAFPVVTVIGFFLLSAWHFGREDQHRIARETGCQRSSATLAHLSAVALGGLVIWIPALVRPDEMSQLLRLIVPRTDSGEAEQIVLLTRWIAIVLCPWACGICLQRLIRSSGDMNAWVPIATATIAASAPILVSFTAYFCLWHSILGLSRLQSQEGLAAPRFLLSIAPLSALAVVGVIGAGWFFRNMIGSSSIGTMPASLQTLFIGLSAIAVPHLLLHEWSEIAPFAERRSEARP